MLAINLAFGERERARCMTYRLLRMSILSSSSSKRLLLKIPVISRLTDQIHLQLLPTNASYHFSAEFNKMEKDRLHTIIFLLAMSETGARGSEVRYGYKTALDRYSYFRMYIYICIALRTNYVCRVQV